MATLRYFMPDRLPGGNNFSLVQHWVTGPFTQHMTRNKPNLDGFPHPGAVHMRPEANKHLAELRSLWHGRLWFNAQPSGPEREAMADLASGDWIYERTNTGSDRNGSDSRLMTFFLRDGGVYRSPGDRLPTYRIGDGLARLEVGWSVFCHEGRMTLVIHDINGAPTAFLERDSDSGEWRGSWVVHERCVVCLRRPQ